MGTLPSLTTTSSSRCTHTDINMYVAAAGWSDLGSGMRLYTLLMMVTGLNDSGLRINDSLGRCRAASCSMRGVDASLATWYFGKRCSSKRQAGSAVERYDCARNCAYYWRQCAQRSAEWSMRSCRALRAQLARLAIVSMLFTSRRRSEVELVLDHTWEVNWKDWEGEAATRASSALLVDIIEEVINKEAIVACFRQEYAAM